MKIGNSSEVAAASAAIEKTGTSAQKAKTGGASSAKPQAESSKSSSAPEASTQLELSSTATQLLQGNGATSESFDAEKVQRITQAIADGKFQVNAEAVADKLLSNAQDVLSGRDSSH